MRKLVLSVDDGMKDSSEPSRQQSKPMFEIITSGCIREGTSTLTSNRLLDFSTQARNKRSIETIESQLREGRS